MIKQSIDNDIKSAMLAGNKDLVATLRTIKSVLLDAEVNSGRRETGLPEEEVIVLLQKEAKKRSEAADLYKNAGDLERASKETAEAEIIKKYLPAMMSEDEIADIVDAVIASMEDVSMQQMGQVIGKVKAKTGPKADGAVIARIVKEHLA